MSKTPGPVALITADRERRLGQAADRPHRVVVPEHHDRPVTIASAHAGNDVVTGRAGAYSDLGGTLAQLRDQHVAQPA